MSPLQKLLLLLFCFCALALGTKPAPAQTTQSKDPVEISAVETLEWDRANKQYIARGAVEVQQGSMFLTCDTLTADYDEDASGKTNITTIHATGNVVLRDTENTAYGDQGTYDVVGGYAKLTGNNLKLVMPDQTITARDQLEYWRFKGQASAIGNAKVDRGEDIITAEKITAFFSEKTKGANSIDRIEAYNNVTITTPEEVLTGDNGTYNAANDTASLIGNVKIVRGPNELEGARAEVNLTTNISKMFAQGTEGAGTARSADGRVRGIFFPGSEDKKASPSTPAPAAAPAPQVPVISAPEVPVKAEPEKQPVQINNEQTAPSSAVTTTEPTAPAQVQPYIRPSRQIEEKASEAAGAFQNQAEEE